MYSRPAPRLLHWQCFSLVLRKDQPCPRGMSLVYISSFRKDGGFHYHSVMVLETPATHGKLCCTFFFASDSLVDNPSMIELIIFGCNKAQRYDYCSMLCCHV